MSDKVTRALWITQAGHAELCETPFSLDSDALDIKTLFSGISRGTERLVYNGFVPSEEHDTMRAPFQEGSFQFPVKYGYAAVGEVQNTNRVGELVFALFPHQARFAVPPDAAIPLPSGLPAGRAVLAANMETALNILWDAEIGAGDRVAIVGCGVVGALTGYLATRVPGTEVCLVDIDPAKARIAETLGCAFSTPDKAQQDVDVVIHTSATSPGFATAIDLAGLEASIVEASWYGTKTTDAPLGGRFHQRRLRIIGSQVGRIPAHRAARWTYVRRLKKALDLLTDPTLDVLISGETRFSGIAPAYGNILKDPATLCHRIRYDEGDL